MANGDFAYRVSRCVRIDDLQLDETHHSTCDAPLPRHFHERGLIALPVHGVVVTDTEHSRSRLTPGDVSFLPAGEAHAVSFASGAARIFSIEIGPEWLQATVGHDIDRLVDYLRSGDSWISGATVRLYDRFAREPMERDLALEERVLDLVARRKRVRPAARRSPPPWLRRARELVADNAREPWRFKDLAAAVGVHAVTLSRTFAAGYGITLSQFLRQRRIDWARTALAGSDLPVGAIALASGFADHAHFSHSFRRSVGMTPSAFRAALRPVRSRPLRGSRASRESVKAHAAPAFSARESGIFAI